MHMLLNICNGCRYFDDLHTFDGQTYPTFKIACVARGLLEIDEEWFVCMQEAIFYQNST